MSQQAAESGSMLFVKAAPPATVSIVTLAGYPVSDILLWATLVYTVLMIAHKIFQIYKDIVKK